MVINLAATTRRAAALSRTVGWRPGPHRTEHQLGPRQVTRRPPTQQANKDTFLVGHKPATTGRTWTACGHGAKSKWQL